MFFHSIKNKARINISNLDIDFRLNSELYKRTLKEFQTEYDSVILFEDFSLPPIDESEVVQQVEDTDDSGIQTQMTSTIKLSIDGDDESSGLTTDVNSDNTKPSKANLIEYLFQKGMIEGLK